jgi:hypothetical protein
LRHSRLLQLAQYRQVVSDNGGTEWMQAKIAELETQLAD